MSANPLNRNSFGRSFSDDDLSGVELNFDDLPEFEQFADEALPLLTVSEDNERFELNPVSGSSQHWKHHTRTCRTLSLHLFSFFALHLLPPRAPFNEAPAPATCCCRYPDNHLLSQEAVAILDSLDCPICPIAIAGLYRTGKSSLLNWLNNRSAGCKVGPTVMRCTRGIWIYGRPKVRA